MSPFRYMPEHEKEYMLQATSPDEHEVHEVLLR